jgi:hypothetical protein
MNRKMTASLAERRSFAIGSPIGIKVSRYYHTLFFEYCPAGLDVSIGRTEKLGMLNWASPLEKTVTQTR